MDSIKNFSPLEGDVMQLTGIDADVTAAGFQQFSFIGAVNVSGNHPFDGTFTAPGQIGYEISSPGPETDITIWLNTDSDAAPEAGIILRYTDIATFTAGVPDAHWFIL